MRYLNMLMPGLMMFFCSFSMGAQAEEFTYGKVYQADLKMISYAPDSTAEAVLLTDEGRLGYEYGRAAFYFHYHAQIKILDPAGYNWADLNLSHEGRAGLAEFEGAIYNLEDDFTRKTSVSKEQMQTEREVDDQYVSKLSFPDVKVGSIIDYRYKMYFQNPRKFLTWYFQNRIPVRFSQFYLRIGGSEFLKPRIYGYVPLKSYNKGWSYKGHHLVMENIPAFREEEEYVKNPDDHYAKVVFEYVDEIADSWEGLKTIILKDKGFGKTLDRLNKINKVYPREKNWTATEDDLKEIHTYLANHFKWDGSLGLLFSDKPRKVWESATASAADINLFLLMFLRKAGFTADPVFLSTIDHGLINREFPTFRQFNYVVVRVQIENKSVLVDATSKLRPFNVLPKFCLNDEGMVLGAGPLEWVPMNLNGERSNLSLSVNISINDDLQLNAQGTANYSQAAASVMRHHLKELGDEGQKEQFRSETPDLYLEELTYEGTDAPYQSVRASFKFTTEGKVDIIGSRLFLSPVMIKEAQENPFKAASRTLPVEFAMPLSKRYFFNLTIPEGYEVEELPETVNFVLPNGGGAYKYICQEQDGKVQVMIRFNINKLFFQPAEYPDFRELFNLIVAKQEEKIVLKEVD